MSQILSYTLFLLFLKFSFILKTMIKILTCLLFLLCGCHSVTVPQDFIYKEIQTQNFTLASWQKITNPHGLYKIYIEGDGHAFNAQGYPTNNPTPQSTLVREIAFGDPSPNVVYLARPCQYVISGICSQRHWTTARFSPEIINAEYEAVRQIANTNPIILIGFSGGAQIAGLLATTKQKLQIKKIITIGGNLDHLNWTTHHEVPPLNESLNLENYRSLFLKIPQHHYVGKNDDIIPPFLVEDFIQNDNLITIVPTATHNSGWQQIYSEIWQEK